MPMRDQACSNSKSLANCRCQLGEVPCRARLQVSSRHRSDQVSKAGVTGLLWLKQEWVSLPVVTGWVIKAGSKEQPAQVLNVRNLFHLRWTPCQRQKPRALGTGEYPAPDNSLSWLEVSGESKCVAKSVEFWLAEHDDAHTTTLHTHTHNLKNKVNV